MRLEWSSLLRVGVAQVTMNETNLSRCYLWQNLKKNKKKEATIPTHVFSLSESAVRHARETDEKAIRSHNKKISHASIPLRYESHIIKP